jgi:hypothetical protein
MILIAMAALCTVAAQAQQAPANGAPAGGRRPLVGPVQNELYHSTFVKLGGGAADGLLYEAAKPAGNARVAVLYSNSNFNFDPPAAELASRGYRVLFVPHRAQGGPPGTDATPFVGFREASRGIEYLRKLPGVQKVVVAGWGAGAVTMTLYADVAAHGPSACQGKEILYPCTAEEASGLAKPDGVILFDPGLGSGTKVYGTDAAFDGDKRDRPDLDAFLPANGYDLQTGTAKYSSDFRKRYFVAESARNNQIIDTALARLKVLNAQGKDADEPFEVPGATGAGVVASLQSADTSIMSHTKRPYTLLKADGTKPVVVLQSIRPSTGPVGEAAVREAETKLQHPARTGYSVREFLANDAIRSTKDFATTDDDVVGVVWKSSNTGTPAQAEGVSVPSLVVTNTCFMFVIASEIVYDHLAAKDKTFVGVEGSEHFFTACKPEYGNPKQRMFDYVAEWLGKPGRF